MYTEIKTERSSGRGVKMIKIAPSILSADFSRLGEEVQRIEKAGADMVHIDVMDGHFVPNITIGPMVVHALRNKTNLTFDVHLMIQHADQFLDSFIDAGADIITVHAESNVHLNRVIQRIKSKGVKAGVSLNPATSLSALDWVIGDVDMVLLMTVNPGFGGQGFIEPMTTKIRALREILNQKGLSTDIQVDGGISHQTVRKVTEAGANVLVSGSALFNSADMSAYIKGLRDKAYKG